MVEIATGGYDIVAATRVERAPKARELPVITAYAGAELHAVWLSGPDGVVWHAWEDPDEPGLWHLDSEPAGEAAEGWVSEVLVCALDNLADPERSVEYAVDPARVERDLAALAELEAVLLAELRVQAGGDAVAVDRLIRGRMDRCRAEIARLASLRATNLEDVFGRDASGAERGAAARVARALGISFTQAKVVLGAGDRYANRARAEARLASTVAARVDEQTPNASTPTP